MMKRTVCIGLAVALTACSTKDPEVITYKELLGNRLNEISGIVADGNALWAITDKPKAVVYKLDLHGKLLQEVSITNVQAIDVEAVTADEQYVYIGDVGDNDGSREERQVIKVKKTGDTARNIVTTGEVISFRFPDETTVKKKKKNNYDCESVFSFGDSLYLFTKRREDMQTELFVVPKTPGDYMARPIGLYDSRGLVTDANYNPKRHELILTGYKKAHHYPFIVVFSGIRDADFLGGKIMRIELANQPWDWQVEGITYGSNDEVYFSCEKTKQVAATLYAVKRDRLQELNKKQ